MTSSEQIARLVQRAPFALLALDGRGRIRWSNVRARRLLCRERAGLDGLPFLDLFAEGPAGSFVARVVYQRFLAGETIQEQRVLLVRGDDALLWAWLDLGMSGNEGGEELCGFAILRECTEPLLGEAPGFALLQRDHEIGPGLGVRLQAERAAERARLERIVGENVRRLLLPLVSRARSTADERTRYVLDAVNDALQYLTHPIGAELAERAPSLTPREIEVCGLVRAGLASKEIGAILGISHRSVEVHRSNVRRKLGIRDPGIRLATFLANIGSSDTDEVE
jgi:DNA-binding CsgD family transcriptional regulator